MRHALTYGVWMMNILVPPRPLSVCEGIDDNSTWGEPILTNNCSTVLDANMSQVRNGQMDLMCVYKTVENLEIRYQKGP